MNAFVSVLSWGASALLIAAMGVALVVLLLRYVTAPAAGNLPFGTLVRRLLDGRELTQEAGEEYSAANRQLRRRLRRNEWALHAQLRILVWVLCGLLLSRLVIFATALVGSGLSGNLVAFFHDFSGHWVRWDAVGYLSLAEQGYAASEQEYLVLLPLYPMLVRLVQPLFLGNEMVAGFVLSNLFLLGSGWALFLLTRESMGEAAARRSVQLLMFCPLSVFFSVPYADSLFLFLTLLGVMLARRHQIGWAVVSGMLAAFTRLEGALVALPIFLEVLRYEHLLGLWGRNRGRSVRRMTAYFLLTMMVLLGTMGYLFINWQVAGNPFAFAQVQAQALNQRMGSIFNTLRYSIVNSFQGESTTWLVGVWLPQSLTIVWSVGLLLLMSARMEPGDGLYTWSYLSLTMAPTWLLTGPRLLAGMYAIYPLLAQVTRHKGLYIVLLAGSLALMMAFSYMYAVVGNVL